MNKKYMNYNDILLGIDYKESETAFALWAPTADDVKLNFYKTGDGDTLIKSVSMSLYIFIAHSFKSYYYSSSIIRAIHLQLYASPGLPLLPSLSMIGGVLKSQCLPFNSLCKLRTLSSPAVLHIYLL